MSPENLAYMANQIGKFFAHQQKRDHVVVSIATHLRQFWDPRMRREILAHFDDPDIHLDPPVREPVGSLRAPVAS